MVAMDYSRRVCRCQRARCLNCYFENLGEFERAIADALSQSFTIDEFGGNKMDSVRLANFENRENVRMIQC